VRIIAFGHKARQGKTWSANYLAEHLPGRSLVWGFGDGLKAVARAGYGMGLRKEPRLLQALAHRMREEDPAVWIRVWEGTIQDQEGIENVLVPDLRYLNEALHLRSMGASLVKVTRIGPEGAPYIADDRDPHHISEVELNDFPEWDHHFVAASVEELAFLLRGSFLEARTPRSGRRMFHLRWRSVPERS
jgi:hypothetical protein